MWVDRVAAGRELGAALTARGYADRGDVIVLGVPRGGVEVAGEVSRALGTPLDIVVVRKIGAPGNPEYAVGAVDTDGRIVANEYARFSEAYLAEEGALEQQEAIRRVAEYRGDRSAPLLADKTAIVVDDGIATGLTARAAVEYLRGEGATNVVLAVPVLAPEAVRYLEPIVDDLVYLDAPPGFGAVGSYYSAFPQLSDADVKALLAEGQ